MQTRSVTKAAERLRVGQPSASYALKRLRELLNDPLFTRTPSGIAPTPRALALAGPIQSILATIETTIFSGPSFDPVLAKRIFRIGASDYVQSVIADPLLSTLQKHTPGCRLILTTAVCEIVARSLDQGEIDLAIGAFPDIFPESYRRVLYREHYECVFDPTACEVRGIISLKQWLTLPHIIMSSCGDYSGPLDETLKSLGERRDVIVSTSNFLAIPFLLQGKRLIAALPQRLACICRTRFGLATCAIPFKAPEFDVTMVWNSRTANEAGAIWLRDQIISVCDSYGSL